MERRWSRISNSRDRDYINTTNLSRSPPVFPLPTPLFALSRKRERNIPRIAEPATERAGHSRGRGIYKYTISRVTGTITSLFLVVACHYARRSRLSPLLDTRDALLIIAISMSSRAISVIIYSPVSERS